MANRSSGPKRVVRRRVARVSHGISASSGELTLHTSTVKETLIRTIIDLSVKSLANAADAEWEAVIGKWPQNVQTIPQANASGTEGDIGDVPLDELIRFRGELDGGDNTGPLQVRDIYRDVKAQRKYDAGDVMKLEDDAETVSLLVIDGIIVTFWKQT